MSNTFTDAKHMISTSLPLLKHKIPFRRIQPDMYGPVPVAICMYLPSFLVQTSLFGLPRSGVCVCVCVWWVCLCVIDRHGGLQDAATCNENRVFEQGMHIPNRRQRQLRHRMLTRRNDFLRHISHEFSIFKSCRKH